MMAGYHVGAGVNGIMAHFGLVFRELGASPRGGRHAPVPGDNHHVRFFSRFANVFFQGRRRAPRSGTVWMIGGEPGTWCTRSRGS